MLLRAQAIRGEQRRNGDDDEDMIDVDPVADAADVDDGLPAQDAPPDTLDSTSDIATSQARKTASTDSVSARKTLSSRKVINAWPMKKQAKAARGMAKRAVFEKFFILSNSLVWRR